MGLLFVKPTSQLWADQLLNNLRKGGNIPKSPREAVAHAGRKEEHMNLEQAADELFAIATGPDYRFECLSLVSPDKTAIVRETPAHGILTLL